jgi:ankyrin repeat protein
MAPIHDAARSGDALSLAKVVDVWGVETVHAQHHQTQWTPLMIAASRGHTQAVHFLLEHGACVDFVAKGYTALYLAAREGRGGVVKLLLERGADPAIKTNVGW